MPPDQSKRLQEEQDAELARLMHDQEARVSTFGVVLTFDCNVDMSVWLKLIIPNELPILVIGLSIGFYPRFTQWNYLLRLK